MKKILSILLCLVILSGIFAVVGMPTSAEDGMLTVRLQDGSSIDVHVGQEFVVCTLLDAGPSMIVNGQGKMEFDSTYVKVVPYGTISKTGKINIVHYSYPLLSDLDLIEEYDVKNEGHSTPSLITNLDRDDAIYYNFSSTSAILPFHNENRLLCRFRFKALAAGETDVNSVIEYMMNEDEVKVFSDEIPDDQLNPTLTVTAEAAAFLHGDADGDYEVTIRDVTTIQKICAGVQMTYDTDAVDATGEGSISLLDAVAVRKYLAGTLVVTSIGTSFFESEAA